MNEFGRVIYLSNRKPNVRAGIPRISKLSKPVIPCQERFWSHGCFNDEHMILSGTARYPAD
jgi:hypothetical protein